MILEGELDFVFLSLRKRGNILRNLLCVCDCVSGSVFTKRKVGFIINNWFEGWKGKKMNLYLTRRKICVCEYATAFSPNGNTLYRMRWIEHFFFFKEKNFWLFPFHFFFLFLCLESHHLCIHEPNTEWKRRFAEFTKEKKRKRGKAGKYQRKKKQTNTQTKSKKKTRVRSKEVGRERKPVVNVQRTPIYLQQQEVEYHFFSFNGGDFFFW